MIVLFTDFGLHGPYLGQVQACLLREAPGVPFINLFADAPSFNPRAAAYLLAAYVSEFPEGSVFLCVIDPGVGSDRLALIVRADGRWFVGPDNGLLEMVARRAKQVQCWEINYIPPRLSATFHGRDLFAPVAARLATGANPQGTPLHGRRVGNDWPDDLYEIVYIDRYGNAMTGVRAGALDPQVRLSIKNRSLGYVRTFSEARPREPFWYENANGLVEIALREGSAACTLGLRIGDDVRPVAGS
jgi:S-adenosylmethionine hydrolase